MIEKANIIEVSNKKVAAYNWIKQAIITNELGADKLLVERDLSDMLGISRTPIREALRMLASEGLVVSVPGKGVFVTRIKLSDLMQIYELKEALERMAVILCIRRKTPELLKRLSSCIEEHFEAYINKDYNLAADKDIQFHMIFIQGAKNTRIEDLSQSLYNQTRRMSQMTVYDPTFTIHFINQHRNILEAIKNNDEYLAEKAISNHIQSIKDFQSERFDKYF